MSDGVVSEAPVTCRVCSGSSRCIGRAVLLERHDVRYYRCEDCGYTQTEEPWWLDEAYSEPIARSDIGLVGRNLEAAATTRAVIGAFFDSSGTFLDYGGGSGLLTRLMRNAGFDFRLYDKHAKNVFAPGQELDPDQDTPCGLVTAFEVVEHLVDPNSEIAEMRRYSQSFLFGTNVLPSSNPLPGQWWYYGLEHGQHVGIFTRRALEIVATRVGCNLYSDGIKYHLLTPKRLPEPIVRALLNRRVRAAYLVVDRLRRRGPGRSLLNADYEALTGTRLG